MASVRRGQGPMILENLPVAPSNENPPISALFLIHFDIKAGYTLGWKRSLDGIELEGVVEYKSLPSGLHTVKEDLIYFVHENHAGLSAFVNAPSDEASRNARMIAVGVLVPLSYGRLGRSWKHAEKLKEMANELIVNPSDTKVLEGFWDEYKAYGASPRGENDSLGGASAGKSSKSTGSKPASGKSNGHNRNRSASDGTALIPPGQNLSAYHPAWSLSSLLETFGPLIFPIHRAALLRKRVLITAHAPVQETCNFVYDLSVLSNIPLGVLDLLSQDAPPQRLRPLFSIGVHDIPLLEEDLLISSASPSTPDSENRDELGHGWIACTTDSILSTKTKLYDLLITMPPPHSLSAVQKVWPIVSTSAGIDIRATQRDLRRYKALRWGLSNQITPPNSPLLSTESSEVRPQSRSLSRQDDPMLDLPDTEAIVEPLSWSALAYSGFMWWASAGEQRLHTEEESDADAALLSNLSLHPSTPKTPHSVFSASLKAEGAAKQEMAIIAYFHRLTAQILTTLSDIVDVTDSDDEREDSAGKGEEPSVYVSSAEIVRMGLDVWSESDHQFIEDIAQEYFGQHVSIEGRTVDICGVQIC